MDEKPKKKSLKEKFNQAAARVKRFFAKLRHLPAIFAETVRDIRRHPPREIGLITAGIVIPGGFFAYGFYRVETWRRRRAANDNKNPGVRKQDPKPPGPQ